MVGPITVGRHSQYRWPRKNDPVSPHTVSIPPFQGQTRSYCRTVQPHPILVATVTSLRVIDSDSTKTHIQLRWLYLYYVQRHTGAKNTGYTGAKTGNPGATIMINTDPKH